MAFRDQTSITVAVNSRSLPRAFALVSRFGQQLLELVTEGEADDVYQIEMRCFVTTLKHERTEAVEPPTSDVGSLDGLSCAEIGFTGSVTMPPLTGSAMTVTVPFDFAGTFAYGLTEPDALRVHARGVEVKQREPRLVDPWGSAFRVSASIRVS